MFEGLRSGVWRWWRRHLAEPRLRHDLVLMPLAVAFGGLAGARNWLYDRRILRTEGASVPVISVGNLAVGGTGKTPVAAEIIRRLRGQGRHPALVLRGYGMDEVQVHRALNPEIAIFTDVRRSRAVALAHTSGHDCVVLDDGFQHRRLRRDLDILLVAAEHLDHPVALLPRGVWREPLTSAGRADLVVVTRKTLSARAASRHARALKVRSLAENAVLVHLRPSVLRRISTGEVVSPAMVTGSGGLAVATQAEPELFQQQLEEMGLVTDLLAFPDHYTFSAVDVERIVGEAAQRPVFTTRKEAVKLPADLGDNIFLVEQEVSFDYGEDVLDRHLKRVAGQGGDA